MSTTPITAQTFDQVIADAEIPVVVDFWASWCGPCRALGPVLEKVSDELANQIVVYKCDVDENQALAARFGIMSIPCVMVFKDGAVVHTIVGAVPEATLKNEILSHI